jgi:GNAT superfamily N-acetyltransferase
MYKVKPVFNDEDIVKFENMRYKAFNYDKEINKAEQSPYARVIREMEKYAFFCVDEEGNDIGGILLGFKKHNLCINYLFVEEKYRNKKAGSFLLNYIIQNKKMFENLFFDDIHNVVAEPLLKSMDFYYENGFDSYRNLVYKKF